MARRLLLDRDGGGEALDQIHVGLFHQLQELPRVGGERLHVAALAFRVERVERERGLPRSGQPGDHDQPVARQVEAHVLEVVRARAAHADVLDRVNDVGTCGLFRGSSRGLQPYDGRSLGGQGEGNECKPANIPKIFVFSQPDLSPLRGEQRAESPWQRAGRA
ncbi:hypothetical protein D3C83_02500 [compost metagenome]